MYLLLIKQFFRSKAVLLNFTVLMLLGILSIYIGKQFLDQKQTAVTKTIDLQKKHIDTQTQLHNDDLGLLLYYLKFSFVKPLKPLAGISIGQSDINSNIQNVTILNLEGQKYDTDLINPMRLQVGNLDLSFVIIFIFPLVIIALMFNLYSEEIEKGTWRMITIQCRSPFIFLLKKLTVRLVFIFVILTFLFIIAKLLLKIPFNFDFIYLISTSYLYLIFWFCLSFFIVSLKKKSNTNAMLLLTSWLLLVVFLPVLVNNYIKTKYPVDEAFTMTIKQRDAYHKKWDTNKKETLDKFYKHYPQFTKYGIKEEGFSWLWYYAMQQMGDDESKQERDAMYEKIKKREQLSTKIAQFFPPLQTQLFMNNLTNTSLTQQVEFLKATSKFHENKRLRFYPKIFEDNNTNSIDWTKQKTVFFKAENTFDVFRSMLYTILIIFSLISLIFYKKSEIGK